MSKFMPRINVPGFRVEDEPPGFRVVTPDEPPAFRVVGDSDGQSIKRGAPRLASNDLFFTPLPPLSGPVPPPPPPEPLPWYRDINPLALPPSVLVAPRSGMRIAPKPDMPTGPEPSVRINPKMIGPQPGASEPPDPWQTPWGILLRLRD